MDENEKESDELQDEEFPEDDLVNPELDQEAIDYFMRILEFEVWGMT